MHNFESSIFWEDFFTYSSVILYSVKYHVYTASCRYGLIFSFTYDLILFFRINLFQFQNEILFMCYALFFLHLPVFCCSMHNSRFTMFCCDSDISSNLWKISTLLSEIYKWFLIDWKRNRKIFENNSMRSFL